MPFPPTLLDVPVREATPGPDLDDKHRAQLDEIKRHFNAEGYTLPTAEGADDAVPLSEREMMFLSQETLLRFLNATKTGVHATIERLERCIVWRRSINIEDIDAMAAQCEDESRWGKNIVQGFTPTGHPIMYFFPSRNQLPVEKRRAVNAVFLVERAMDLMTDGVTSVSVVFNFGGKRQGPPASVSMAHKTLHIMSEYYPETLGLAILQDMPWVVRAFVNLMWPFVDHHTKSKIKFAAGKQTFQEAGIGEDILLTECGGKMALKYDHDMYWPTLIQRCKECREEHLQRWRALGPALVGREEREFKIAPSSPTVSLSAPLTPTTKETVANGVDVRTQDVI